MNNSTTFIRTNTCTKTDIRKVWEYFKADVLMLARRTHALDLQMASDICNDIRLMAYKNCLKEVHIQLYDRHGRRVRAHKYRIQSNVNWEAQRPSENRWPRLPDGTMRFIVSPSDRPKLEQLKASGSLQLTWRRSSLDTTYLDMRNTGDRKYASNSYGWERLSYSI